MVGNVWRSSSGTSLCKGDIHPFHGRPTLIGSNRGLLASMSGSEPSSQMSSSFQEGKKSNKTRQRMHWKWLPQLIEESDTVASAVSATILCISISIFYSDTGINSFVQDGLLQGSCLGTGQERCSWKMYWTSRTGLQAFLYCLFVMETSH